MDNIETNIFDSFFSELNQLKRSSSYLSIQKSKLDFNKAYVFNSNGYTISVPECYIFDILRLKYFSKNIVYLKEQANKMPHGRQFILNFLQNAQKAHELIDSDLLRDFLEDIHETQYFSFVFKYFYGGWSNKFLKRIILNGKLIYDNQEVAKIIAICLMHDFYDICDIDHSRITTILKTDPLLMRQTLKWFQVLSKRLKISKDELANWNDAVNQSCHKNHVYFVSWSKVIFQNGSILIPSIQQNSRNPFYNYPSKYAQKSFNHIKTAFTRTLPPIMVKCNEQLNIIKVIDIENINNCIKILHQHTIAPKILVTPKKKLPKDPTQQEIHTYLTNLKSEYFKYLSQIHLINTPIYYCPEVRSNASMTRELISEEGFIFTIGKQDNVLILLYENTLPNRASIAFYTLKSDLTIAIKTIRVSSSTFSFLTLILQLKMLIIN